MNDRQLAPSTRTPADNSNRTRVSLRADVFSNDWSEIVEILECNPTIGAKGIMEWLIEENPCRYNWTHLRTLQRKIKQWRMSQTDISFEPTAVNDIRSPFLACIWWSAILAESSKSSPFAAALSNNEAAPAISCETIDEPTHRPLSIAQSSEICNQNVSDLATLSDAISAQATG